MIKAVIFDMYETLITHFNSPVYFGTQMAIDAGITEDNFQRLWKPTEAARTIGNITLEKALEMVLIKNNCFSKELLASIVEKRIAAKEACFQHMHPEILPLFHHLKKKGIKIGLISNCFSEEASVIRKSILFPYFDAAYLSYEQGIQKPDAEIYKRCIKELMVKPDECLYIGDGGSHELEAAKELGMEAAQAAWYLKEGTPQPSGRKENFKQLENPLDVLNFFNTPALETERLILRKFTPKDMEALFLILKDEEVNKFLPWYPMKDIEETKKFYEERYAAKYEQPQAYAYAICLKSNNLPIGYIKVDMEEHHDFGYGLRKEFWHQGIVTEAGKAVVEQVKKDGLPYITATHDRNNPSGGGLYGYSGIFRYTW